MIDQPEDYFPFEFETRVDQIDFGRMVYHVVFLPPEVVGKLTFGPGKRLRVEAEIGEFGWKGALSPTADGRHSLLLGARCLKANRLTCGSPVEVRFRLDDPDCVIVPAELERALEDREDGWAAWQRLTAGHQRGLCYRVESAQRVSTRLSRVAEVLAFLDGHGPDPSKPAHRSRPEGRRRLEDLCSQSLTSP